MISLDTLQKVKVSNLLNKEQHLITYTDNGIKLYAFQSYKTLICVYNPDTRELLIDGTNWDISRTTLKHLAYFLNTYTSYRYKSRLEFAKLLHTNPENLIYITYPPKADKNH